MSVRRIVPDIQSEHLDESREFYVGLLGFTVAMDMGWIMTLACQRTPQRNSPSCVTMPRRRSCPR